NTCVGDDTPAALARDPRRHRAPPVLLERGPRGAARVGQLGRVYETRRANDPPVPYQPEYVDPTATRPFAAPVRSASRIAAGNATSVHAPGPTAGVAAVAPDDDGEPAGFDPCGEPCTPIAAVPPPDPLRRTRSTTA